VRRGNIHEPIFEVLHKTGCVPQPRELVCVRCGYNVYGREIDDMIGIMRLHYKNKHSQWSKRIDFDQFIRCYRNFWIGKFETEEKAIQLDMARIGIELCKNLKCQFVCSKYTTLVEHMMMEHNKRWDYKDDMNPFWKLVKYNLEEGLNNMSWTMISKRKNIWFSNEGTYENMEYEQTEEGDKQGSISLNAEDEESFHLQTTKTRKLKNFTPIIDLTAEKKESIRTKSIKKFISEERKRRTIRLAIEGIKKEKN
jgi:hypothetical protein